MPAIVESVRPDFDEGPVLVTAEYRVKLEEVEQFLDAIHENRPRSTPRRRLPVGRVP